MQSNQLILRTIVGSGMVDYFFKTSGILDILLAGHWWNISCDLVWTLTCQTVPDSTTTKKWFIFDLKLLPAPPPHVFSSILSNILVPITVHNIKWFRCISWEFMRKRLLGHRHIRQEPSSRKVTTREKIVPRDSKNFMAVPSDHQPALHQ